MNMPKEIKGLSEDAYRYGILLKIDVDLLVRNQNIVNELVKEKTRMGNALVDVEDWLSGEMRKDFQSINSYIGTLLKKHGVIKKK